MANIRTYLNLFVVILMVGLISSCNNNDSMLHDESNVKLTLNLGKQIPLATRTTDNGIDALNENLINKVDFFFYKKGAKETDEPIYYTTDIELPSNAIGSAQMDIFMPKEKYNELFPTDADTECLVYAIVNRPTSTSGDNALPTDKSLGSLKENTILCAEKFAEINEDTETHFYRPSIQDNFVMDGSATITRNGSELIGSISVERVAAKITLYIDGIAPEVVDDQNVTWLSDINSVRLSLRRASIRTKLGSTPATYIYGADEEDIFNLNAISLDKSEGESKTTSVPFYTYPTNWTNDENSRTHFILVVEWIKKNSTDRMRTFYEVNVNAAGSYTERNHHYVIRQEISVLGSTTEENPKKLYSNNYIILDWGNAMNDDNDRTDSEAELSRFKYLVVNETKIEMENTVNEQINFFSSAPIYLTSASIRWEHAAKELSETLKMADHNNVTKTLDAQGDTIYTFYNSQAVDGVPNRIVGNDNNPDQDYRIKITIHNANLEDTNDQAYINVEHKLNNEMVEEADFTQYYIDFTVQHQNDKTYNETINITQYPMIFISADQNYDYDNNGYNNRNQNKGFVYVNASQNSGGTAQWYHVVGMSYNTNPNRYIISVSSLTADANSYMIGDPRSKTPQNPSESAINADSNGKKLTQYRPTSSNDTEDMLSPQFMIASSYGNCPKTNMSRDEAERRCATYQEDGYLAGRWRIPTRAEIEYIAQLYAWEKIPPLFSSGMSYWSAQGCIQVNNNQVVSSTSTTGLVRCVYDTWYWGTEQENRTQYIYGDVRE